MRSAQALQLRLVDELPLGLGDAAQGQILGKNLRRLGDQGVAGAGKRGRAIRAGQPVMTGTIVQCQFLKAGDKLEFEMDGMPPVYLGEINFEAYFAQRMQEQQAAAAAEDKTVQ